MPVFTKSSFPTPQPPCSSYSTEHQIAAPYQTWRRTGKDPSQNISQRRRLFFISK